MALFDVVIPTDTPGVTDSTKPELDNIVVVVSDSIAVFDSVTRQIMADTGAADTVDVADTVAAVIQNTLLPANVRALNSTRIRVDFTTNVVPNTALSNPSAYQISVVSAGAVLVVPQQVFLPVGQPNPLFVEIEVTEMTDGAIYQLNLSTGLTSVSGEPSGPVVPAFFAGIGDAPDLFVVVALDKNTCEVRFTEPMLDNAAIRDLSNYIFDGGLSVTSIASVQGSIVTIKTTDQVEGQIYNLTVRGLLEARQTDQVTAVDSVVVELGVVSETSVDFIAVTDSVSVEMQKQFGVVLSDIVNTNDNLAMNAEYARSSIDSVAAVDSGVAIEFTGGGGTTPDTILDPSTEHMVWYDPALGFTTAGGKGSAWVDQFGSAYPHDQAQATGVNQPNHFNSGGMNGQPYVEFLNSPVGEEDWMSSPTGLGGGQFPASMTPYGWAVVRIPAPGSSGVVIALVDPTSPQHRLTVYSFVGTWRVSCFTSAGTGFLTAVAATSAWSLIRWGWDGANVFFKLNNGATSTIAHGGTFDLSAAGAHAALASFDGVGAGSVFGNVEIGEVIMSRVQPSAGQQANMLSYLNGKYAGGWS